MRVTTESAAICSDGGRSAGSCLSRPTAEERQWLEATTEQQVLSQSDLSRPMVQDAQAPRSACSRMCSGTAGANDLTAPDVQHRR